MNMKKSICALMAGSMLMCTCAMAKDNIYAYNKFISTILGPQNGYCDFAASFAGHETEYADVNDYFTGLISAFYEDIDGDFDNELVTVDTRGVSVYQAEENGVVFLGSIDKDLIENYGDSYANVFTVKEGRKTYIGLEKYSKTMSSYSMYMYDLDPDTDEFKKVFDVSRESNEDGIEELVWAKDKTYYSFTNADGLQTSINPDNYSDCAAAASAALKIAAPAVKIDEKGMKNRVEGTIDGDDFRFYAGDAQLKTYIKATGLRFSEKPVVMFEDKSDIGTLSIKPDIVTVTLDGETLQFPTQDPMITEAGHTFVPMRTIFEALGAQVDWIDKDGVQKIIANTADVNISMTINSAEYFVNGESRTFEEPAQLMNDKTMVPLRAVSESFGCDVKWDGETKTVIIENNQEQSEE